MATYKTDKFEAALLAKGFVRDKTHHMMFWYYLDGKKTALRTRTSNGEKEFDDSLFAQRRKQLGNLSKEQFSAFIECPLTAKQYEEHLLDSNIIKASLPKSS